MCDPLTSAACVTQIAVGTATGDPLPAAGVAAGVAGQAAGAAAGTAVSGLAGSIQSGIGIIARDMVAWWISIPSPDLATDPVPHVLQTWLLPITTAVALFGVLAAGTRMMLTRKSAPLIDVGTGLLTLLVTTAVGTLLPALLLKAGDAYSSYVLSAATGGQFGTRFTALLTLSSAANQGGTAAILIVIGIVALLMTAVQAVLLILRQGAVLILAGLLPLGAATALTQGGKPGFRRLTGWTLAIIIYKPAAASVYAAGFLLLGRGNEPQDVLMGISILALSLVAMPALMRFFTWPAGQLESGGGGGIMSSVIGGAAAIGAMRSYGGGSLLDQARAMGASAAGSGGSGGGTDGSGGGPGSGRGTGGAGDRPGGGPGTGGAGGGAGTGAGPRPASGGMTGSGGGSGGDSGGSQAAGGRTAPAAGSGSGPPAGGSGSAAAGSAASGAAAGAGGGASGATSATAGAGAGAAVPPAGLVMLGGQAARGAAGRLADGAAPPRDQR